VAVEIVDVVTNINILEETHVALASKRTMFANFLKVMECIFNGRRNFVVKTKVVMRSHDQKVLDFLCIQQEIRYEKVAVRRIRPELDLRMITNALTRR
jgi:hypothetical protein